MSYSVCCVPVGPLRLEPSHRAEMVTQQLFGESCEVIEAGMDDWVKVRCLYDQYEGWCHAGHVTPLPDEANVEKGPLTFNYTTEIELDGQKMMVPMGSSLAQFNRGRASWNSAVRFSGNAWDPLNIVPNEETFRQIACSFLNTAYLWGGKSVFGVDCSGFVQTVFKFLGIPLPRDSAQQAVQGTPVATAAEARCGDLAFFDNAHGRITHVGLILGKREIIHSSVKVRIDAIDDAGIMHRDTLRHTHRLAGIKRLIV